MRRLTNSALRAADSAQSADPTTPARDEVPGPAPRDVLVREPLDRGGHVPLEQPRDDGLELDFQRQRLHRQNPHKA